jgi:hypothetical protein
MHFMHPTGSRRYASTWSRCRSARRFVLLSQDFSIQNSKKQGGWQIHSHKKGRISVLFYSVVINITTFHPLYYLNQMDLQYLDVHAPYF